MNVHSFRPTAAASTACQLVASAALFPPHQDSLAIEHADARPRAGAGRRGQPADGGGEHQPRSAEEELARELAPTNTTVIGRTTSDAELLGRSRDRSRATRRSRRVSSETSVRSGPTTKNSSSVRARRRTLATTPGSPTTAMPADINQQGDPHQRPARRRAVSVVLAASSSHRRTVASQGAARASGRAFRQSPRAPPAPSSRRPSTISSEQTRTGERGRPGRAPFPSRAAELGHDADRERSSRR